MEEYNIRENYLPDKDRILEYDKIQLKDYNSVIHKEIHFPPSKVQVDKWPKFYEK